MLRTITNELRLVRSVVAGVKRWADMMAESFLRRAVRHLQEGEELPVGFLSLLQTVVARMIESDRDHLTAAEVTYRNALRAEKRLRDRREVESGDLYQKLLKARKTFEAFGRGASSRYLGLEPGFGDSDPQVLLRYAHESVDVLSDPGTDLPDITDLSVETLSPEQHVNEIRPAMVALEGTLAELEDQKRETEHALKVKTQALESLKETFIHGSRLSEALYVLAGERFHSARLRPRVGRGTTIEPDPFAFDDTPADGEEAAPPFDSPAEAPSAPADSVPEGDEPGPPDTLPGGVENGAAGPPG